MPKNIRTRGVPSGVFDSWARWARGGQFGTSLFVCLFVCLFVVCLFLVGSPATRPGDPPWRPTLGDPPWATHPATHPGDPPRRPTRRPTPSDPPSFLSPSGGCMVIIFPHRFRNRQHHSEPLRLRGEWHQMTIRSPI